MLENVEKSHKIAKTASGNMGETRRLSIQFSMVRRYDEKLGHVRALESIDNRVYGRPKQSREWKQINDSWSINARSRE